MLVGRRRTAFWVDPAQKYSPTPQLECSVADEASSQSIGIVAVFGCEINEANVPALSIHEKHPINGHSGRPYVGFPTFCLPNDVQGTPVPGKQGDSRNLATQTREDHRGSFGNQGPAFFDKFVGGRDPHL